MNSVTHPLRADFHHGLLTTEDTGDRRVMPRGAGQLTRELPLRKTKLA